MPKTTRICSKCGGPMELGYMADKAHGDRVTGAEWVEGQFEPGFSKGLFGSNTQDRRRLPIQSLRCIQCGLLELYANPA